MSGSSAPSRSSFSWASLWQEWSGRPRYGAQQSARIGLQRHLSSHPSASVQAQIFLLIVLIAAIINYFIGTFIPFEFKKSLGFFGYDGKAVSWNLLASPSVAFSHRNLLLSSQDLSCGKTWDRTSEEKRSSQSSPSSSQQPLVSWLEPISQGI